MSELSDLGSDAKVGSEVEQPERSDVDYGDGDGVNDFDESYKEMQQDSSEFSYQDGSVADAPKEGDYQSENRTDMSSEEKADDINSDIENDVPPENVSDLAETSDMDNNPVDANLSTEERADAYNEEFEDDLVDDNSYEASESEVNDSQDYDEEREKTQSDDNGIEKVNDGEQSADDNKEVASEEKPETDKAENESQPDYSETESADDKGTDTSVDETEKRTGNDAENMQSVVEGDTEDEVNNGTREGEVVSESPEANAESHKSEVGGTGKETDVTAEGANDESDAEVNNDSGTKKDFTNEDDSNNAGVKNDTYGKQSGETDAAIDGADESGEVDDTEDKSTESQDTEEEGAKDLETKPATATDDGEASLENIADSEDSSDIDNTETDANNTDSTDDTKANQVKETETEPNEDESNDVEDQPAESQDTGDESTKEVETNGDASTENNEDSEESSKIDSTETDANNADNTESADVIAADEVNEDEKQGDDKNENTEDSSNTKNNVDLYSNGSNEEKYEEVNKADKTSNPIEGTTGNDNVTDGTADSSTTADELNSDGVNDSADSQAGDPPGNEVRSSEAEKGVIFENCNYHQGQNDVGALGTCGLTSIANSLNRVTGTNDYSENGVLHNALDNDLCHKSDNPYSCGGTTTNDVVKIIDNVKDPESNIHTEVYEYDKALDVDSLANRLDDSGTVAMVGVDSATLWDQRGDVCSSGLFQGASEAPSDHWITVDSPVRDENGSVTGFNIVDSGGGVDYVDRDKFERMYAGDDNHRVSDPTAIIISDKGNGVNTYSQPDGGERTASYKGSAVESDGRDPNVDVSEVKSIFSRDNFKPENSYDVTCTKELADLKNKNVMEMSPMGTEEASIKRSARGDAYTSDEIAKLKDARESIEAPRSDTVMQKVVSVDSGNIDKDLKAYLNPTVWDNDRKVDTGVPCDCKVYGYVSKAEDTAPYTTTPEKCYETVRLDYEKTPYVDPNQPVYVVRYTGDTGHYEIPYSKEFGGTRTDGQPFTGNGYTGSSEHVVPEYVSNGTTPSAGEIYRIKPDGTEELVAYYDSREKIFKLFD